MSQIIDGKKLSSQIKQKIKSEVASLVTDGHRPPSLCVVLVDDEASKVYVGHKEKLVLKPV